MTLKTPIKWFTKQPACFCCISKKNDREITPEKKKIILIEKTEIK